MNDLIRKNFKVKKVTSSAKSGETVIISEDNIDTEAAKKAIKDIGYEMLSATSEPYEKKAYSILESRQFILIAKFCIEVFCKFQIAYKDRILSKEIV